jgi:hypothetical protein
MKQRTNPGGGPPHPSSPNKAGHGAAGLILTCALCAARCASLSPPSAIAESVPPYVTGITDRIAVYTAPDSTGQPIAWLPSKAILKTSGSAANGNWLSVDTPDDLSVWVYRDCVSRGAIQLDRARVRSGAGMSCPALAELPRGTPVEIRGRYGDWLRIKAPSGIRLWVLRSQVDPAEPPGGRDDLFTRLLDSLTNAFADAASATNPPPPAAASTNAPPPLPPELAGYALRPGVEQGRKVTMEGTLDWSIDNEAPFPFCIVRSDANGDLQRLCQVFLRESEYSAAIGSPVTVAGSLWRLEGVSFPVLIPYSVAIKSN